jgi:hypothetical protein
MRPTTRDPYRRGHTNDCEGPIMTITEVAGEADKILKTKVAALDTALAPLGDRHLADGVMDWEYLLVAGIRR